MQQKAVFALCFCDKVLYHGKEYLILAKQSDTIGFDDNDFYMTEGLTSVLIKNAVIQIYKILAEYNIANKVFDFSKFMKLSSTAVKINPAKTRWGSCSGKNSINFSWSFIFSDNEIMDYVVVHELVHN